MHVKCKGTIRKLVISDAQCTISGLQYAFVSATCKIQGCKGLNKWYRTENCSFAKEISAEFSRMINIVYSEPEGMRLVRSRDTLASWHAPIERTVGYPQMPLNMSPRPTREKMDAFGWLHQKIQSLICLLRGT